MKQDPLRNYIKKCAKANNDFGQVSDGAIDSIRMATEHFIKDIAKHIHDDILNSKRELTGDILKEILLATPAFNKVHPVLTTLSIAPRRETQKKRKGDGTNSKRTKRSKLDIPEDILIHAEEFNTMVKDETIVEDDDYDASD